MVRRMDPITTSLTIDGMTVQIQIQRTEDGPLLTLGGDCELEGVAPGEYLLFAAEQPAAV